MLIELKARNPVVTSPQRVSVEPGTEGPGGRLTWFIESSRLTDSIEE